MVGWHHWLNGHESEQTLGVGDGQGGLACCSPWRCKESDTTEWLNWLTDWYSLSIFKWSIPLKGEKKNYCVRGSRELQLPLPHPLHSSLSVDSVAHPSTNTNVINVSSGGCTCLVCSSPVKGRTLLRRWWKEWLIINIFFPSPILPRRGENQLPLALQKSVWTLP